MWVAICDFLKLALEEVAPMLFYLPRKNQRLRDAGAVEAPGSAQEYQGISEEELKAFIEQDRARAAAMDEKTFKLSLSLTVALTILGTLSPLLLDRFTSETPKIICAILIAATALYAISSGFVALGAMRSLPTYGFGPLGLPEAASGARRRLLAESLARNHIIGIARHLRNEASYQLLRNGLICFSAMLLTYIVAIILGAATITLPQKCPPSDMAGNKAGVSTPMQTPKQINLLCPSRRIDDCAIKTKPPL